MLITCPNCQTAYEVEGAKLGPSGRPVRCAQCGETWVATASRFESAAARLAESPPDDPGAAPSPHPTLAGGGTAASLGPDGDRAATSVPPNEAATAMADEIDPPPTAALPVTAVSPAVSLCHAGDRPASAMLDVEAGEGRADEALPQPRFLRSKPAHPWPARHPSRTAFAALVVLAATVVALVSWRTAIVRIVPQTARLYAALGLPVNLRGLAFTGVKLGYELADGVPVMVVEGAIVNTTKRDTEVPRLRFAVRNAARLETYAWTSLPAVPLLPAGESVAFRTRLASPPADARDVLVRFHNRRDLAGGG